MKIALNIPDQLMKRLAIQMERNGQSAAEVIRTAMIGHFDRQDSWYTADRPFTHVLSGEAQGEVQRLEPGQTGGFGLQTVWKSE